MDPVALTDLAARLAAVEEKAVTLRRATIVSLNPTVVEFPGGEQVNVDGGSVEPGAVGNIVNLLVSRNDVVVIPRAYHGEYSPSLNDTLVNQAVAPTISGPFQWYRTGNRVTVFGRFSQDPTTVSTVTEFRFATPNGWGIDTTADVAGVAFCVTTGFGQGGEVTGDATGDKIVIQTFPTVNTAQSWTFIAGFKLVST